MKVNIDTFKGIEKPVYVLEEDRLRDNLKLIITGIRDTTVTGKVEFYLGKANSLVEDWTYVDLSTLKEVDGLTFSFTGTRENEYGLLTPTYFAFDNLGAKQ